MRKTFLTAFIAVMLSLGVMVAPAFADGEVTAAAFATDGLSAQSSLSSAASGSLAAANKNARIDISKAKVVVKDQLFTGKKISPKITVKLAGKTLIKGRNYTINLKNNVQPGKAKVLVKGVKKYKGTAKATFRIKTKKGLKKVGSTAYYFTNTKGTKATGWVKDKSKWYLGNSKGKLVSGWKKLSGKWYYLDPSSYAMKTGWQKIDGSWYYLYDSGAMAAGTWVGDYYLRSNGKMATNTWIGNYWVNGSGKWTKTKSSSESYGGGTVYITTSGNGTKLHRSGCRTLSRSTVQAVSRSDATSWGYTPCKVCNP